MLTRELTILSQSRRVLPPHAWFVVGESPRGWIDEIVGWGIDDHKLRLVVVPRSRADLKPIGVLVFRSDGAALSIPSGLSSTKTLGYGLVGAQVYLPCDAAIEPAVTDKELSEHLLPGRTYLWHPTAGLVAANADEILSISDLFLTPEPISVAWGEAESGTAWAQQLSSVALSPEANIIDAFEKARDDIGSKADDIKAIEPIEGVDGFPNEPRNSPLDKARDAFIKGAARSVRGMTDLAPVGGDKYTWVNQLRDWAGSKLQQVHERLEQQRFKELFRLQKLLDQNPDEGLRYALPLNSNGTHRGTAAPSGRLRRNRTDFRLSGLRGGGPTDYWDVPYQLRSQLNKQYRELAEREVNLGRYQRAAYIYGELLADLNAAARTLEAGKHYREAAVVYREKLNRIADAARCLEKGGLWSAVIALREDLQQFEMAGDVYMQLGLEDQANAAYKKEVDKSVSEKNFVGAARIEETKLDNIDAALAALEQGWPDTHQAHLCVKETFRILGAAGRHDETNAWIQRIENVFSCAASQEKVIHRLSLLANKYPNQTTRQLAHEATYRIVSAELIDEPQKGQALLSSIVELHPEDQLLLRDCSRFRLSPPSTQIASVVPPIKNGALRLLRTFGLPEGIVWIDGIKLGPGYLIVGQKNQHVTMLKLSSDFKELGRQTSQLSNPSVATFSITKTLDNRRVIVHCPLDERFESKEIFATDDSAGATVVGSSWIDSGTLGIAQGPNEQWIVVRFSDSNELLLEILSSSGELVTSKPLEVTSHDITLPVPIYSDGVSIFLGIGTNLLTLSPTGEIQTTEFDSPIRAIQGSARPTISRIALSFDIGVEVLWTDSGFSLGPKIGADMNDPKALFTRIGRLVVAAEDRCEIYNTVKGQVKFVSASKIEPCKALMRCKASDQIAMLTNSGKIRIYKIPVA